MVDAPDLSLDALIANWPGYPSEVATQAKTRIAQLERDLAEARKKLFPYAGASEICGFSTNGLYLIGDKKSIDAARKAFHYSAQIEEYRAAFNERIAAAEAERDRLAAALVRAEEIASEDRRSDSAKKSGYKPEWYKHGLSIAKRIGNLRRASLQPGEKRE